MNSIAISYVLLNESRKKLKMNELDDYQLPRINTQRFVLKDYMRNLEVSENRVLIHMTTTYLPYKKKTYRESDINTFFINFYVKKFLPYLLETPRYNKHRLLQPITYTFIDEHESKSKLLKIDPITSLPIYAFPSRLHHHSILAVHRDTLDRMNQLVGTNTINNNYFSKKIMTSDIQECDAYPLLYASKLMCKYPEFLMFPDKLAA